MAYDAGEAFIQITPSFKGVVESITAQSAGWGKAAATSFTETFNESVKGGINLPVAPFARQGDTSGGAFADAFKARVDAALKSLPDAKIDGDTSDVDLKIAGLRTQLEALRDLRIGVDIDADEAQSRLAMLQAELTALRDESADVQVKVDTAKAILELAAFRVEADALSRDKIDIPVDTTGLNVAEHSLGLLSTSLIALGPAVVPVGAAMIGAFGGAAAVVGALAGAMGVVALGAKGVAAAVKDDVTPAFHELQQTAVNGLLPGVEASIHSLISLLPQLDTFVDSLAHEMGNLAAEAGTALTGPFWRQFFDFVQSTAGPVLETFGHIIGDLAQGFAGLVESFAPITTQIGAGLAHLASEFAAFGANAGQSAGFQSFLGYIEQTGPLVVHTILDIGAAFGHIAAALAPLGTVALEIVNDLAKLVTAIPTSALTGIAAAVVATAVALKGLSIAAGAAAAAGRDFSVSLAASLPGAAAIAALGLVTAAWEKNKQATAAAQQAVDRFVASLNINTNSISSIEAGLAALNARYDQLTHSQADLAAVTAQGFLDTTDRATEAQKQAASLANEWLSLSNTEKTVQDHTQFLADAFGISTTKVTELANANDLKLNASLKSLVPEFASIISSAQESHDAVGTAATAFADLGNKANSVTDDIKDLDTAWQSLVGNFIDAKTAETNAAADLLTLKKALDESNGSLNKNTEAGNSARSALLKYAGDIKTVADAVYNSTGSYKAAAKAADGMLQSLKNSGSAGPIVKKLVADIESYLAGLKGAAEHSGENLAQGLADGIRERSGVAITQAEALGAQAAHGIDFGAGNASPSKKAYQSGLWLDQGFANGLFAGLADVVKAARHVGQQAADEVARTIRQAVKPDPTSVAGWRSLLNNLTDEAIDAQKAADKAKLHAVALKDQAQAADQTARSLQHAATQADNAAQKAKTDTDAEKEHAKQLQAVANAADKNAKAAQKMADAADKAAQKASDAYDKLKSKAQEAAQKAAEAAQQLVQAVQSDADTLQSTISDFTSSISSGIAGDDSLETIWQSLVGTDADGNPVNPSIDQVKQALDGMLATAQQFSADLTQIVKEGGSQTLIQQIVGLGPVIGDSFAQSILAAGPQMIQSFSNVYDQINQVSQNEATTLAQAFFGAGVAMLEQMIKGLEKAFPDLKKALQPILQSLQDTFTITPVVNAPTGSGTSTGSAGGVSAGTTTSTGGTVGTGTNTAAQQLLAGTPWATYPLGTFDLSGGKHLWFSKKANEILDQKADPGGDYVQIPGYAQGVMNAVGGLSMVGENGPELMYVPPHATVVPNTKTPDLRPLLAGITSGQVGQQFTVYAQFGEETIEARSVRVARTVLDGRLATAKRRANRGVVGTALDHLGG